MHKKIHTNFLFLNGCFLVQLCFKNTDGREHLLYAVLLFVFNTVILSLWWIFLE